MSISKILRGLIFISFLFVNTVANAQIGPPPTYYKIPKQTFRYTDMTSGATKTLNVRGTAPTLICFSPSARGTANIKKAVLNLQFNWDNDYLSANTTTYALTYTVTAYSTFTGTTGKVTTYTATNLTISNSFPVAYAQIDFTGLYNTVNRFDVKAGIVTSGGTPDATVNGNLYSDVYYTEEFDYDVNSAPGTSLINLQNVTITGDNLVKFSWVPNCPDYGVAPNYQFQLLRLYNNDPTKTADERDIRAYINWDEALTIETGNSSTELSLTIAEGTGYYLWRVRPIGNAYEGGIANDLNWGQWAASSSYVQGTTTNITTASAPYLFYFSYNKWDLYTPSLAFNPSSYPGSTYNTRNDGERNWIFNRNFVEGDATTTGQVNIGEGISYANKLQMATQKQSRIVSEKKKVISQGIYDYSGRSAMQVLPTPVAKNTLSYEPVFVRNSSGLSYSAYDFDIAYNTTWATDNYKSPLPMDSVVVSDTLQSPSAYYSSNNRLEDNVPTASGYPFTRTLFSKDGKNTAIETSMPGKEHRLTTSSVKHTTRLMESGISDMEVIRIFGDEAPSESSVYKTITIDPNDNASVSYISKEGKTIATCLSGANSPNLQGLPSSLLPAFTTSMDINASNSPAGTYAFRSFKTLGLTEATNVTLNYGITPNTYSDEDCYSACQTCDYLVTLKVTDNNDDIAPIVMTFTLAPPVAACTPTSMSTSTVINLPAGLYTIERTIESNTSPAGSSTTYINSFIQTAQTTLSVNLNTGTGTLVDDLGAPLSGSPTVSMSDFFSALTAQDLTTVYSLIGVETGDTHKNINIGCNTIRVPVWPCSVHTCDKTDMDFEGYLYIQAGIDPSNSTAQQATLTAMFGSGYTLGDFNNIVQNMYNAGYACNTLWNCWQGTVAFFLAQHNPALSTGSGPISIPGGPSFTPGATNYLDNFLTCTGYRVVGISSIPGSGVCPESSGGYFSHPYAYIKYQSQCCACEQAFYSTYTTCAVPATPSPTSSACSSISSFTAWFNSVNTLPLPCGATGTNVVTNNKESFYKCLINNANGSSSGCSLIAPSSTAAIAASSGSALVNACLNHCEGLYDDFVAQNISMYHGQGSSVQGDTYDLVNIGGAYYVGTVTHTPSVSDVPLSDIYCRATILVDACKYNCSITVQSNGALGSPAEIANIQNVFSGQFVVAAPTSTNNGVTCPKTFSQASQPSVPDSLVRVMVRILNNKLSTLRASAPADGMWWDFYAFMNSVSTSMASNLSSSSPSVFIHPGFSSYFSIIPGVSSGNRVVYYFNRVKSDDAVTPANNIYSIPLVSASSNFIYSANTTSVVSSIVAASAPSYIFSSSFQPVTGSSTGTCITVAAAVADAAANPGSPMFNITPTSTLNTYNNSGGVKGYWVYDISKADITGNFKGCDQQVCYKLQPTSIPEGADVVDFSPTSCEAQTCHDIASSVTGQIADIIGDYAGKLRNIYYTQCISKLTDTYKASYPLNYHHYTLYYYDRAGNLVKTVPPAGVDVTSTNRTTDHPAHAFITEYAYNSLGQLVRQKTPDGGESIFFYDAKGKLRISQNAKQLANNKYSYTKYDALTRIVEGGEFTSATVPTAANIDNPSYPSTGTEKDITKTVYSSPATGVFYFGGKPQRFLDNRVSYSLSDRDGNLATINDQVSTYYSYDPHGNAEWVIQDVPELGRNYIAYEYDQVSSSVTKVKYNEAFPDKFFHRYTYDADKRLKTVETSYDGAFWEKDASYKYYLHGPLKRAEIGHDRIQGQDYVYTIHGWLKALNGPNKQLDPGGDGALYGNNMYVPRDAYAMTLGYYSNDYNCKTSYFNSGSASSLNGTSLYNGNISSWTSIFDPKAVNPVVLASMSYTNLVGRKFTYDQLNRLVSSYFNTQANLTSPWVHMNDYTEGFTYDANGNIITLLREGKSSMGLGMDDLTYYYYTSSGSVYTPNTSAPAPATNVTNKLAYVTDNNVGTSYTDDIEPQAVNNYSYDPIGNLIKDDSEHITSINWNVYGKITDITKVVAGVTTSITFLYDAAGNRVLKKVSDLSQPVIGEHTTYYVKDAHGNPMAVYTRSNSGTSPNYTATYALSEQALYGSDRLGLQHRPYSRAINFTSTTDPTVQVNPVFVHTSSYPYIMLPLSNTTQKQVYSQDINTNSSTAIVLGAAEYTQSVPAASTTVTYRHSKAQAMAYDMAGNVILSAYTYSLLTGGVYSSATTVLYIRDITATTLTAVNNSPESQAVFLKKQGTDDQYYFFTVGTNGQPYYHVIDANTGAVISKNNELDVNTDYGTTMALFEDRTGQGNTTLYLRRYNSSAGTSSLAPFSITEGGIQALTPTLISSAIATSGNGEIVVSPTGGKLAVVTNTSAANFEVKLYTLSADHQGLTPLASRGFAGSARSVEFTDNDVSLFYTTNSGTSVTLSRLPVSTFASAPPVTMSSIASSTVTSAVRKGVNGKIYYMTQSGSTYNLLMFTNPDAATTALTSALGSVYANGSMPVQPHLLAYATPTTVVAAVNRQLNLKEYEMKDHLGNVHATLTDFKTPFTTTDVYYKENFNAATAGGFVALSAPAGTTVDNIDNRMRVTATTAGGAAQKSIPLSPGAGQYYLSFDYDAGTCSAAQFDITNLAPSDGVTSGALIASGSYNYIIKVPTGMSSLDLRFEYQDATSGKTFYIDNILVKKIDETTIQTLGTVVNEDFSSPSDWVAKNTVISYSGANMQVTKGTASSGVFSVTKNLNLTEGQLYKITFDITGLSMGTSSLSMALENDNGAFTLLDYSTAMNHSSTGSYTYYITPKTNKARIIYNVLYTTGTFNFTIDNFKVDDVGATLQPMYTSSITALHDYYAFGSPMPGRNNDGAATYRYGFNGKEKDPETVTTGGNTYDYGFRIYNPSLGKFLSVDPLTSKYAFYTPYQFAGDKPIVAVDLDGREDLWTTTYVYANGQVFSSTISSDEISYENSRRAIAKSMGINPDLLPKTGFLQTRVTYDENGKAHIDYSYTPTTEVIAFKHNPVVRFFQRLDRWLNSKMGKSQGEWEGKKGFEGYVKAINNAAEFTENIAPYMGEFAPAAEELGEGLSIFGDIIETAADIDEKGLKQGVKNGGIRIAFKLFGQGINKCFEKNSGAEHKEMNKAGEKAVDESVDKLKEKAIEKSNEQYYDNLKGDKN